MEATCLGAPFKLGLDGSPEASMVDCTQAFLLLVRSWLRGVDASLSNMQRQAFGQKLACEQK